MVFVSETELLFTWKICLMLLLPWFSVCYYNFLNNLVHWGIMPSVYLEVSEQQEADEFLLETFHRIELNKVHRHNSSLSTKILAHNPHPDPSRRSWRCHREEIKEIRLAGSGPRWGQGMQIESSLLDGRLFILACAKWAAVLALPYFFGQETAWLREVWSRDHHWTGQKTGHWSGKRRLDEL